MSSRRSPPKAGRAKTAYQDHSCQKDTMGYLRALQGHGNLSSTWPGVESKQSPKAQSNLR
ncbi:hypothetical protein THAOC_11638, partial [Thalassiosira oceanica]